MPTPEEHPESAELRAACERQRVVLANLLAELHGLRAGGLAHARALYASLFGPLEIAAVEAEIELIERT